MSDSTTTGLLGMPFGSRSRRGIGTAILAILALIVTTLPAGASDSEQFSPNPHEHTVVFDWVEAMLEAIELNPPAPTATTWRMWVVMSSIYDAWSAYDPSAMGTVSGYDLKRPISEATEANKAEAISHAAHTALSFTYPNQADMFDAVLDHLGYVPSDSLDPTTPAGIGNISANRVIEYRSLDGSNALGGFTQVTSEQYPSLYSPTNSDDPNDPNGPGGAEYDINHWQPLRVPNGTLLDVNGNPTYDPDDPSTYTVQTFLTPHWGAVIPFALTSGDQFRPQAPPQLGSDEPYVDALGNLSTNDEAFRTQSAEIQGYSATLTDEQKVIAEFWADGPHTWTPPGHWVQIALGISLRDSHSIDDDARMFMALTGAVLDSGISAWEAKRHYDYVRPVTAIRELNRGDQILGWAGPNQGTQLINGEDWQPYQSPTFVTPPFAEYVSGHSTFSRSAAEVLTAFAGTGAMYDGTTLLGRDYDGDGVEDLMGQHIVLPGNLMFEDGPAETIVLRWPTLLDAAEEAGFSRRYGGIHFQDGDMFARQMGADIGGQAFQWAELHWDPFGELVETLDELASDGEVSHGALTSLGERVKSTEQTFAKASTTAGCSNLKGLQHHVDNLDPSQLSDDAHSVLSRQLGLISELLCG